METKERITIDSNKAKEIVDNLDNKYLNNCDDTEYPSPNFLKKYCYSKFAICHSFNLGFENFLVMEIKYPELFDEKSYHLFTKYFIEKHLKEDFDKKPLITQIDIYSFVNDYLRFDDDLPKNIEDVTDEWLKKQLDMYFNYVMFDEFKLDYNKTTLKFLINEVDTEDRQNVTIRDYIWELFEELKFELFGICLE